MSWNVHDDGPVNDPLWVIFYASSSMMGKSGAMPAGEDAIVTLKAFLAKMRPLLGTGDVPTFLGWGFSWAKKSKRSQFR